MLTPHEFKRTRAARPRPDLGGDDLADLGTTCWCVGRISTDKHLSIGNAHAVLPKTGLYWPPVVARVGRRPWRCRCGLPYWWPPVLADAVAVTHWEVLARYPGFTHVRCRLETGRTHQIRVHMAYLGHPILGDTVYGAKKPVPGLQGQCLHAVGLRFIHPRTGETVELTCPLPEEFRRQLRKLETKP